MFRYAYRWIYVFIISAVIVSVGFFYDIRPKLKQISALDISKKNLVQQLALLKSSVVHENIGRLPKRQHDALVNPVVWLSGLLAQAYLNGLQVQEAFFLPEKLGKSAAWIGIKLVISGEFMQIFTFLSALNKQVNTLQVADFIYKLTEQNKLLLAVDIMTLKHHDSSLQIEHDKLVQPHLYSPFCAANHGEAASAHDSKMMEYTPLQQMKMVGYLDHAERHQALLMLPNSSVMMVDIGNQIGKERGIVTAIDKHHVVVAISNGSRFWLQM